MSEELLETVEEMIEEEMDGMVEGVTEALETVEVPLDLEIDVDVVKDTLSEYSKGAVHATTAIGAGFGVYKLLKNRKKIKDTVKTFIDKNKEAIKELKKKSDKPDKPEVVEAEVIDAK